jgi:hypothetical protein
MVTVAASFSLTNRQRTLTVIAAIFGGFRLSAGRAGKAKRKLHKNPDGALPGVLRDQL